MKKDNSNEIKTSFSLEDAKKVLGLKSMAYKEYLSARSLFNSQMLHQGAIFMNTALEKAIKSCLYTLGIPVKIQHDTFKLLQLFNSHDETIREKFNPDFFKVISKIYSSRYYEDLGAGYNFVIMKNKFLAEFDYIFSILESKMAFHYEGQEVKKTAYDLDIEKKNPLLWENNYLLNDISKIDFLNGEEHVYEFRIQSNHQFMEVLYKIPRNVDHNKFIYEGLKPLNDIGTKFQLSNIEPKESGD